MTEETLMFIAKYFVGFVFGYVLGRAIFKKK